ncbi:MAG: gfo/Idh/MocA family oxidoreductase [Candidatus Latescibacteria bacterium]|nr:gfo/Idh/MocA family oxidoreductase [Candidatus Latescibacterota bacterium]
MVRVGMLSFAHVHAHDYARQVGDQEQAQLVGVWDQDEERGRAGAQAYDLPYYSDLEIFLNQNLDAVVVSSETDRHPQLMVAAARAGKHIFTEKALALNVADCDQIIAAVEASGVEFAISLPSRSSAEMQLARKVVDEGLLGQITFARGRIAHNASLDGWFKGGSAWFVDAAQAGGGALFDLGCHRVDALRWLLGPPKRVTAIINHVGPMYEIDDNSATIVEFANGALGVIDVAFVQRSGPNPFELYGTDGALILGQGEPSLTTTQRSDDEIAAFLAAAPGAGPSAMTQWIGAIEGGEKSALTLTDGRNLSEILQAAYQAAATGKAVDLPL